MLNFAQIRATQVNQEPYPYMVVQDSIAASSLAEVVDDFPVIHYPGSIPVQEVDYGPGFKKLMEDLEGPEFRGLLAEKFGVSLDGKPIMTTVRGVMREKDGRIHTDSKTKIITVLLYFNESWPSDGGYLRILRDNDLESYVEEIPPKLGTMVVFKVTDHCWHGHKPVVGKRLSIQMNYLTGDAALGKHQFFHRISARLKKLFKKKHG